MQSEFPAPVASTALPQFLRGIGKRGYVLAEAQCGASASAQQALRATLEEFSDAATHLPLALWPEQFWQRLLAQPALRNDLPSRDGTNPLAHLSAGPRAALLLRLVAGLDNAHGAAVLRVSPGAYRQALQRALHALHGQGLNEASLRDLRGRLQQRVKELPEAFLHMPANRVSPRIAARATARVRRTPSPWLRPVLAIFLCILILLFAGTFFPRPGILPATTRSEQLPEQPVAARLSPSAAALASPDFELLNDPDGERDARDLALLSWYDASSSAQSSSGSESAPASLPESTTPETSAPDTEQGEDRRPGAP
jgi:hypothetical protein